MIKEDCFWIQKDKKMIALCSVCGKKGWFWKGSELGYGDYDLKCESCGRIIHQRGEKYEQN